MNSLLSPHSHSTPARSRPGLRQRGAILAVVCTAAASLAATPALAAPVIPSLASGALLRAGVPGAASGLASSYGEEHRFGGFDGTGSTPGKFDLPVGFAVDPSDPSTSDGNAVYVLDRVVNDLTAGKLGYRLQKLSSTGTVLGSVTLPVQTYTDTSHFSDANPLISLAVDPAKQRVYALVEGIIEEEEGNFLPVARELVAWSTVPSAGKLVAAPGLTVDSLTGAGLVAGSSVLESSTTNGEVDLYAPEALTVDPANHDVVIEAQKGLFEGPIGGPTILQRVITEGPEAGKLGKSWVADKAKTAPNEEQGDGLFTAADGSLGVDLYQGAGAISRLADVQPNFEKPEASFIAEDTSKGKNKDQAPTLDNNDTINYRSGRTNGRHGASDLEAYTAGTPITQLTNTLYAARYGQSIQGTDLQSLVEPWNGLPYFWTQANFEDKNIANMGVRLFTSEGTVVTTIGGQAQGQACNLDTEQLAVAAGANGSVFVLTQPNEANGNSDDQVIEFAPGGKGECPQPSGSLTLNGESGSSYSFPVGTNVKFADTVERKGEAPYRFDWVLLNASTLSIEDLKTQIEAPTYTWPVPSTNHTFAKAGTYYAAATLYGDYGLTYITTVKITIR